MFEKFKEEFNKNMAEIKKKGEEKHKLALEKYKKEYPEIAEAEQLSGITVSTCGSNSNYEIIDVVYENVTVTLKLTDWSGTKAYMDAAFLRVKALLKISCAEMGGDAVINCGFNHQYNHNPGSMGASFWGYGTVVKYVNKQQ